MPPTLHTRRGVLSVVAAALGAGCSGGRRTAGSPQPTDTWSPSATATWTPKYTPIRSTPARPADLTSDSVESYVEALERTTLWNSVYSKRASYISVNVDAIVDVETAEAYFAVVVAKAGSGGSVGGKDAPDVDTGLVTRVYAVGDDRTVRFEDPPMVEHDDTVGTPAGRETPTEPGVLVVGVYNADASAHAVTLTVDGSDGRAVFADRSVAGEAGVEAHVDVYPGTYAVEATLENGRTASLELQTDRPSGQPGPPLALYVTAGGDPVLSRWPPFDAFEV